MWRSVDVFANRHYRLLWVSSLFSFTGMQMQHVARALLAWDLTHSFGAIGAISLSFGLPMLLFSLVGGSLADRFEKRNLSLLTQALTAAVALVNAVLVGTDVITFEMLFLLGLILGTFSALGMPARTPLMAEVVGQDHMMGAIAMSNAAMNGTRLFGPAVAGVMAGFWGIESAYFAMAGLYAISCLTLLQVPTGLGAARRAGAAARRPGGGMLGEISNGLRYVATDPRLRLLNLMMIIITIFAMPYTLLLAGFVQKDLGRGSEAFGFMQSFSGAGALVGSIGVAFLTRVERKPLVQWCSGCLGGAGLIMLAIGSASLGYGGALVAVVVIGLATTAYQTLNSTMVMADARPEYYGRVMSINMLTFSAMPLMALPLGAVADAIGARETFFSEGAAVLALLALVALVNPVYTFGRARSGGKRPQARLQPAAAGPAGFGSPPLPAARGREADAAEPEPGPTAASS